MDSEGDLNDEYELLAVLARMTPEGRRRLLGIATARHALASFGQCSAGQPERPGGAGGTG